VTNEDFDKRMSVIRRDAKIEQDARSAKGDQRFGAVIVFKKGITREQAEAWLRTVEGSSHEIVRGERADVGTWVDGSPYIDAITPAESFDATNDGFPVWYIP
jgi:hypothetical protein